MNFYKKTVLDFVPENMGKRYAAVATGANLSIISDLCRLVNSLLALVSGVDRALFAVIAVFTGNIFANCGKIVDNIG